MWQDIRTGAFFRFRKLHGKCMAILPLPPKRTDVGRCEASEGSLGLSTEGIANLVSGGQNCMLCQERNLTFCIQRRVYDLIEDHCMHLDHLSH